MMPGQAFPLNLMDCECIIAAAGEQPERRGRPLDDAWGHAKPLDDARQKTRCNHCGFVSTYGGISRLKAHLGGGSPQMQLQSCPQVPLEVKRVMEQWFSEWSKNSAAAWTRNSNGKFQKFMILQYYVKALLITDSLQIVW